MLADLWHYVQYAPTGELSLLIVITGLLSTACIYAFVLNLSRARLVADTPTAKIRSAHQGHVELSGKAVLIDGAPIISPLTHTQCVWYEYSIEQQQRNRRGGTHSRSVERGRSDDLFYLQDDTGLCVIDPHGARVFAQSLDRWSGSTRYPEFGPKAGRTFLNIGNYVYNERRLEMGEQLYVIGYFRTHGSDFQVDLKDEISAILRDWKKDPAKLASLGLKPGDPISSEDWEKVRMAAKQEALLARAQRATLPSVHLLSRGPNRHRPFVLSAMPEPEKRVIWHYRRYAIFSAIGIILFGVLSLFMLVVLALVR